MAFNIVLFGPPGAGKGTVAKKLTEQQGLVHLSTGDMLRDEIARGTAIGSQADALISQGNLVPDAVVVAMIRSVVQRQMPCKGFIFDGFPRTTVQAQQLDEIMAAQGTDIAMMISLTVNEDEIIRRLQKRAEIEGRADDADIRIIRNRLATYHKKTEATSDYYKAQHKFHAVSNDKNPDDTLAQIVTIFKTVKP
jgi:adenylate kinase